MFSIVDLTGEQFENCRKESVYNKLSVMTDEDIKK